MTIEALLPSEIARLVLGYLEEHNCSEAAKMFLIMSPLLQECYSVVQKGGKFTRKVHGITLMDLIDKFCAINTLVQEKLSKIENCEQVKSCGDLLEQVRFLIDGSRGQRFVVNINVPSQNSSQASGGSPIISSSLRKRRHSGPVDRERTKKSHKSILLPEERQSEPDVPQWSNTIEATSLDQLPGHQNPLKIPINTHTLHQENSRTQCPTAVTEASSGSQVCRHNVEISTFSTEKSTGTHDLPKEPEISSQTCETGTDTEELMAFTNTEVQTAPCEQFESSSDSHDGPVENLSLLTKELLNRTELQERIAQTINRALIPADMSLRESSFSESTSGECNTSIMRELDNAIKSIVIETETDPVFEQFLLETIGQGLEGELSPDEDGDGKSDNSPNPSCRQSDDSPSKSSDITCRDNVGGDAPIETHKEEPQTIPKNAENPSEIPQESSEKMIAPAATSSSTEKNSTVLDDVNAQAILSIINVNNTSKEQSQEKQPTVSENSSKAVLEPSTEIKETLPVSSAEIIIENVIPNEADTKVQRKKTSRVKREKKVVAPEEKIPEQMIPIPTLVVCSQQEIENLRISAPRVKSKFVPIVPKDSSIIVHPDPTLYLRTVNVVGSVKAPEASKSSKPPPKTVRSQQSNRNDENPQLPQVIVINQTSETVVNESITLYGTGNATEAVLQNDIEAIQLEESMSISGTGLSPYLKLHGRAPVPSQELNLHPEENQTENNKLTIPTDGCDAITKRTPRSILKSRSRNHRLSLSTPRRRSNHIRALDFNTPTKGLNSSRRHSDADKSCGFSPKSSKTLSKACRTSLFKSPQCGGHPSPKRKQKTPIKLCRNKIPIATRSPAPKLVGEWDKITGVGMIIDGTSQSSSSSPAEKDSPAKTKQMVPVKKSWDADLRMAVIGDVQPVEPKLPKKKETVRTRRNSKINKNVDGCSSVAPAEANKVQNSPTSDEKIMKNPINVLPSASAKELEKVETEPTRMVKESITTTKVVNEQGITKKYAKLKTLTTSVTKVDKDRRRMPQTPGESLEKISELGKIYSSKVPDLETPRKFDPNLVPPTPRVLSPNSSMTTPFAQVSEDSGKIQSFVLTPEFPPTPSISMTPKQSNGGTADNYKKDEYGSSYYQPSSELSGMGKNIPTDNPDGGNPEVISMLTAIEAKVTKTTMTTQVFEKSSFEKLEITQFEVIKENLPKEQAIKELKISTSSETQKEIDKSDEIKTVETNDKSGKSNLETSGTADDSSDSESDTSSSSSSSSSSCCSCCDNTNNSSRMSISRKSCKTPHKIDSNCAHDATQEQTTIPDNASKVPDMIESKKNEAEDLSKEKENCESQELNETSPIKIIPITKTEEALKDLDMETPAKDEGLLAEADISETPSSSKSGIDSLTNLNSKISAIIREDSAKPGSPLILPKKKPKIISIQDIPVDKLHIIKVNDVYDDPQDENNILDAKLARELEEKRRRTLDKLRAKPVIPLPRSRKTKEFAKNKSKESVELKKPQESNVEMSSKKPIGNLKPVRKSVRNAEKQAKRGMSEPRERSGEAKQAESQRKTQSSRESSTNEDEVIEDDKKEAIDFQANTVIRDEEKIGDNNGDNKMKKDYVNVDSNKDEGKETGNDVKGVKSKVDLVKRDLFSDEENGDAICKKLSKLSDDQTNDTVAVKQQNGECSNELPGVLESLQLVPANKSFGEADFDSGSYEHIEISFVYDETAQQPKKRRRKVSISDLEMKVQTDDATGEPVWTIMSTTSYEEIFNISPPRKKRNMTKPKIVKEKPVTTLVSKRKGKVELKNSKSIVSGIQSQPLATSSPNLKETVSKAGEKVKAAKNIKTEERGTKSRKRKISETKEEQTEKKLRPSNPKVLLNQINIDKILNKVHGPESCEK